VSKLIVIASLFVAISECMICEKMEKPANFVYKW
jgi:hypothetical protein